MRNSAPVASLFFVPLLALSIAAGAATPIDQTRALDARGRIDIENIKGSIKEGAGKVLGDSKLEAEGKLDKAEGKVQNTVGGIKDTLRDDKRN
jgi:uncharacterized protein YjbJ (UPF0337 family)